MCVLVAEWSKALVSRPEGASDPSSRNILFLFLFVDRSFSVSLVIVP